MTDKGVFKVFISSTYEDLVDYRKAAIEVVNRYQDVPVAMEFLGSRDGEPKKVCNKEIRGCDIFVGIYAYRYGFIPEGEDKSITCLEYELAKKLGKPRLCFIVKKGFAWNPDSIEIEAIGKLKDFLDLIKKERAVDFFTSVDDFGRRFSIALANKANELRRDEEPDTPGVRVIEYIPKAPLPYMAHPYALPKHFTGREAEKAMLGDWFHNGRERVLVLEAIGGMGKSALCWSWLREQVIGKDTNLDGVLWWSFYDAPLEEFLDKLCSYACGDKGGGGPAGAYLEDLLAVLYQCRFLLVLDGFERALRGYGGMNAAYRKDEGIGEDKALRQCINPVGDKFLRCLTGGNSKVLITSRLFPVALEGLAGTRRVFLPGLSKSDAVTFLRSEGITGNRAELENAGAVYKFHPLMLKLLASSLQLKRKQDIGDAYKLKIIDQKEPQKILARSTALLSKKDREILSTLAVFRASFAFDTARALFPKMGEDILWPILRTLERLGFLFHEPGTEFFDFHPILRAFLYDGLSKKNDLHQRAAQYFQALPKPQKVVTLADLAPAIELYHHLVRAGQYDQARNLFKDRLEYPTYFQLAAYELRIELLTQLFPEGLDQLPRLTKEPAQAWTLNSLANSYALSGAPARAVPLYFMQHELREKNEETKNLAIGLGNTALMAQIHIGQSAAAAAHLRKENLIGKEIQDVMEIASSHQELGRLRAYQGSKDYKKEFDRAFTLFEKDNYVQSLSVVSAYRALAVILQARWSALVPGRGQTHRDQSRAALDFAHRALGYAEEDARTDCPTPRDFVQAYWLLGRALVRVAESGVKDIAPEEIRLYDDPFQRVRDTLAYQPGGGLEIAGTCLAEALRRCRAVNLVESEPDILLATAQLAWARAKGKKQTTDEQTLEEIERILTEAQSIALRSGYRFALADIHLFCAQVEVEAKGGITLLGLDARAHLEKAREYALDVSEFKDLYKSKDPEFYKDIPEYEMLKRGMSDQERIEHGYYMAYKVAEELEKRL